MNIRTRVKRLFSSQHPDEPGRPLLAEDERLVLAVSGGPDSLTLLHLVAQEELHPRDNLVVAHLDHALRPESSVEAGKVRESAHTLGIRSIVERRNIREYASDNGLTIEEAGREARYEFLARVAMDEGAAVVATGHTADDQAETVLMNLLRGSGPRGMRGMLPVGLVPGSSSILLARPLLSSSRSEIEAYCRANDLSPIEDKTNLDPTYFRSWIRVELLPLIAERVPGLANRLTQTAEIVAADYDLLDNILDDTWSFLIKDGTSDWLKMDSSIWSVLPLSLRRSTLRKAVATVRGEEADIGYRTIELARKVAESGQVGSMSTLPDGVNLTVGYDELVIAAAGVIAPLIGVPQMKDATPLLLTIPGEIILAGEWLLQSKKIDSVRVDDVERNADSLRAFVSLPEEVELVVRPAQEGERFQPLGLDGHSALVQDVMVNRKIPKAHRRLWPIVAAPTHLVWFVGHQVDQRARIRKSENQVILLSISRS